MAAPGSTRRPRTPDPGLRTPDCGRRTFAPFPNPGSRSVFHHRARRGHREPPPRGTAPDPGHRTLDPGLPFPPPSLRRYVASATPLRFLRPALDSGQFAGSRRFAVRGRACHGVFGGLGNETMAIVEVNIPESGGEKRPLMNAKRRQSETTVRVCSRPFAVAGKGE